jgi:hypothetical protein
VALYASAQAKEVCGPGPHTLDQVALDIYLLPGSTVILQAVPYKQQTDVERVLRWYTTSKSGSDLPSEKLNQSGNNFEIGPMDQNLSQLVVNYSYVPTNTTQPLATSNIAVLHLATWTDQGEVKPDSGYKSGRVVQVLQNSPQRIYCFKIIPYVPATVVRLFKDGSVLVPENRYYVKDNCLWMNSPQQTDSASYRLDIEHCFSSITFRLDFSLSVNTALPPVVHTSTRIRNTPSHSYTHEPTTHFKTDLTSKATATTSRITKKVTTTRASALSLDLNFSVGTVNSRDDSWNVSLLVNATVVIHVLTSPSALQKIVVRPQNVTVERFQIDFSRHTIKVEKIQLSDQGLYVIVAHVGKTRAKARVRFIVQDGFVPSTTPITIQTKTYGSLSDKDSSSVLDATLYSTVSTNSSHSTIRNQQKHKDAIQGWVIGIIILCFLIFAIPAVYFVHKHCRYCRSKPQGTHRNNFQWKFSHRKVVIPNTSTSKEIYINDVSQFHLTDTAAAEPKQQPLEVEVETKRDPCEILPSNHDHDKNTGQTQGPVLYATVNIMKKVTSEQPSAEDPTKGYIMSAEQTTLKGEADERAINPKEPQEPEKGEEILVRKSTREPPSRPTPYHASNESSSGHVERSNSKDNKTLSENGTNDLSQVTETLYAKISKPAHVEDPDKQSGEDSNPLETKKHTVQYVELDVTALTKM